MNQDVERIEVVDPSYIPFNVNREEYYLIDEENEDIKDLFYISPNIVKSKIDKGCIVIKIIKKQGQKS